MLTHTYICTFIDQNMNSNEIEWKQSSIPPWKKAAVVLSG